ncbi:hypothetical protein [Roseateles asaccharophilus]|nr:hypothetical protein [Roseateles asaccharophilus]
MPDSSRLEAFIGAAATGRLLWARWIDGELEVRGGPTPDVPVSDQIGHLFVLALRERYGDAASAVAEREWRLSTKPRRLLPARTVRRAVACAEAALSLLQAQSHLLQFEFSAQLLGWRFRRVAESLGLDPVSLGSERRRALDQALEAEFRVAPADADAVATRLRELLVTAAH